MENFATLTPEQIENPFLALEEVFEYAHYLQMKEALWIWYKTTVNGSFNHSSRRERDALTTSYEFTLKMLEAANILHQNHIANTMN